MCGVSVSRKEIKRCRKCWRARGPDVSGSPLPVPSPRLPYTYDEALVEFKRFIACSRSDYQGPATGRASTTQTIAVCSDLHAPFQDMRAFAAFLERTKGADLCIVAGDVQDHYAISRFLKYEAVPMSQELAAAQMIFEKLSETFPKVIVVSGNHDSPRFEKLLADRLPHEAIDIIRHLTGGTLSTIDVMVRQFPNVTAAKNRVAGRFDVNWYHQEGDLLVTHAEKFSVVPGSAMRSIESWLSDFEATLGLQPWRVVCQAHTHALGWFPWKADRLLVESGCLCMTHGYQLSARIGGRPQRLGWVTLEQSNGVTDLSSVRPRWYRP
jgi:predicted phosphodiesterase